jgi:hypothetical protein
MQPLATANGKTGWQCQVQEPIRVVKTRWAHLHWFESGTRVNWDFDNHVAKHTADSAIGGRDSPMLNSNRRRSEIHLEPEIDGDVIVSGPKCGPISPREKRQVHCAHSCEAHICPMIQWTDPINPLEGSAGVSNSKPIPTFASTCHAHHYLNA